MKFKFQIDPGYWALPVGFGIQRGYFWFGVLCFNLDVSWAGR